MIPVWDRKGIFNMPIPHKTLVEALLTERTCGDACWHAREDICHCSCGGKNHGCMRNDDGEQPARTKRVKESFYQLVAVEAYNENECIATRIQPLRDTQRNINNKAVESGRYEFHEIYGTQWGATKQLPTMLKTASESEVNRWVELAQWRNSKFYRPLTLWVKTDMLDLQ